MFERRQLITHSQNLKFLLGRLQLLNHLNFSSYKYFSHHPLLFLIRKSYNLRKKERKKEKNPAKRFFLFLSIIKKCPSLSSTMFCFLGIIHLIRIIGKWEDEKRKEKKIEG